MILLTGHKGFIGGNIAQTLKAKGTPFIGIDKEFITKPNWESHLKQLDVSAILHVGACADTMETDVNKMMYENYYFTKVLIDTFPTKKFVFSSSASLYGDAASPLPRNLYAWSKLACEDYGRNKHSSFVSLRYFNVYGPGEEKKGKMASVACQAYKAGKFKLFPSLPKRDFVFVEDVVRANLHSLQPLSPHGVFDVGLGFAHSFEEVLDYIEIPYTYRRAEDIPKGYQFYTCADSSKFLPEYKPTSLVDGLQKYKEYLNKQSPP